MGSSHVVAVPFIWPGHVAPMLHLCKCLAAAGCTVTLLKVPDRAEEMGKVQWDEGVKVLSGLPLPPPEVPSPVKRAEGHNAVMEVVLNYFKRFQALDGAALEVIEGLSSADSGVPKPTCIISDVYVGWAREAANKLGVPWFALWTSTVAELAVYYHSPQLVEKGIFPFSGPPSDKLITCIPGLPALRPTDYPTTGFVPEPALCEILCTFRNLVQRIPDAKILLVNSIYELEKSPIDSLRTYNINVQPVGPLHQLSARAKKQLLPQEKPLKDPILEWLDSKPSSSVLYIAFGTTMPVEEEQFLELTTAIEACGHYFIWSIRQMSLLPEEFRNRIASTGQGLLVPFAPQQQVLNHPSVGAFFTHCGWNSVLEAITIGVPMIARPLSGDQVLTKKFLSDEWGLAWGLSGGCYIGISYRDEIKKAIDSIMNDGPEAARLKNRAEEVRNIVADAVSSSSRKGLEELVSLVAPRG